MARGVGLDAGVYEVKVVELDGSYRKPRLIKVSIDRVAGVAPGTGEERRAELEAEAALHALKDQKVNRQGLNLGFPGREAVIRNLRIPFVGDDAIRKVIKFEAENAIHSHNVDDMIVDFATYDRGEGESSVLVAAVPKKSLSPLLAALEEHGIEPERVDLDAMALFRAAEWAGCFGEDAAEAAAIASEIGEEKLVLPVPKAAPVGVEGRRARIVVDVGARATRVLAVIEDRLIDLRALRLGVDAIAEGLAEPFGLSFDEARDVVRVGLSSGRDVALDAVEDAAEGAEAVAEPVVGTDSEVPVVAERPLVVTFEAIDAARSEFLDRLQRELLRFLTGLPRVSGVERLFVTGGGSMVPGVNDKLADVFGCPVQPLDVLAKLSHGLDAEETEQIGPRIATAVGLALAMLGGRGGFNFRQEELSYRRHFDRIKFPLAIACMLAVFLPFMYGIRQYKQLTDLSRRYGELFQVSEGGRAQRGSTGVRAVFWGYVGLLMNEGQQGNNVGSALGAKKFDELTRKLLERPTFERLPVIRTDLEKQLQEQQEQTGVYEDLQLPSGVYVLSYFSSIVEGIEDRLGSFLITEFDLNMQPKQPSLTFKVVVRGPEFRQRFTVFQDALRATFAEPNSPFQDFGLAGGEDVFTDSSPGGAVFTVKIDLKEDFETRVQ